MELFIGAHSELGATESSAQRGHSQHLLGNDVDFVIDGLTRIEVYCPRQLGNP